MRLVPVLFKLPIYGRCKHLKQTTSFGSLFTVTIILSAGTLKLKASLSFFSNDRKRAYSNILNNKVMFRPART